MLKCHYPFHKAGLFWSKQFFIPCKLEFLIKQELGFMGQKWYYNKVHQGWDRLVFEVAFV